MLIQNYEKISKISYLKRPLQLIRFQYKAIKYYVKIIMVFLGYEINLSDYKMVDFNRIF